MPRILALAFPLSFARPRRRQRRHLPRVHLRRGRQGLAQRRLEEHRRRRRRRGLQLRRQLHRADRPGGRADGQQHVSALTFTSPAGHDDRRLRADAPDRLHEPGRRDTHRYFLSYSLGPTDLRRRGQLRRRRPATRSTPRSSGTAIRRATSPSPRARSAARASPRSRATRATPTTLSLRVGCYKPRHAVLGQHRRRDQPHPPRLRRDDQRPDGARGDGRGVRAARGRRAPAARTR